MPMLREVSRQEYLRKREDKKIQVGVSSRLLEARGCECCGSGARARWRMMFDGRAWTALALQGHTGILPSWLAHAPAIGASDTRPPQYTRDAHLARSCPPCSTPPLPSPLQELEDELEDAKYLFQGVQLSQRELDDLRYKEEVLRLAKEKQRLMNAVRR